MRSKNLEMKAASKSTSGLRMVQTTTVRSATAELATRPVLPRLDSTLDAGLDVALDPELNVALNPDLNPGFFAPLVEAAPFFQTLTIVIPVYNERNTVLTILERVLLADTLGLAKEILVVDDCSTDGTWDVLQRVDWEQVWQEQGERVRVLRHDRNRGKGACVRTALEEAKGELVLVQDADLEYDPGDYPALLSPILDGRADAVFGNRFHPGAHRVPRLYRFVLNRMFSILCNLLTSLALTDVTACYKVMRRDMLDELQLETNRFSMETELTVKLARTSARIYEVPIVYHGRTYAEGKKISWVDGLAACYHLFRYRFF